MSLPRLATFVALINAFDNIAVKISELKPNNTHNYENGLSAILDVFLNFEIVKIIKKEPLILGYHCLRAKKAGYKNFVDIYLILKLKLAYVLIEKLENKIRKKYGLSIYILTLIIILILTN